MRTAYAKMKVRGRTGGPSSPWRVFDRTGIKTKAVKGRVAVTIFLNKSANFFLQRPYLPLEQGITRGCFSPVGAAPVHVPLLGFPTKSGTSTECCWLRSTI